MLSSPANWDVTDVDLEFIERTIKFLTGVYEYVIIDCATGLDDENLSTVTCCDALLDCHSRGAGGAQLVALRGTRLAYGISPAKLKVVINRCSSDRGVTIEQFESNLNQPVQVRIVNNPGDLRKSVDVGTDSARPKVGVRESDKEVGCQPSPGADDSDGPKEMVRAMGLSLVMPVVFRGGGHRGGS